MSEDDIKNLYKVKKNFQIPLIQDRGFDIDEEDESILNMNYNEFVNFFKRKSASNTTTSSFAKFIQASLRKKYVKDDKIIYIYFITTEKKNVSKAEVTLFINHINSIKDITISYDDNNIDILLFHNKPIKSANLELLTKTSKNITLFDIENSLWNPARHALANKAIKSSNEEVINNNNPNDPEKIIVKNLPRIQMDDPLVKYYGWKKGDIIKFIRDMRTDSIARKKEEFRIVV